MSKELPSTNVQEVPARSQVLSSSLGLGNSFVIGHSSFVIRTSRFNDSTFIGFYALLDNPTIEQVHVALGVTRETRIVRDHADRRAFTVQFAQQLHHRLAVFRVEVSGRFVRQQDGGFAAERAGDSDALLLAAGKL